MKIHCYLKCFEKWKMYDMYIFNYLQTSCHINWDIMLRSYYSVLAHFVFVILMMMCFSCVMLLKHNSLIHIAEVKYFSFMIYDLL